MSPANRHNIALAAGFLALMAVVAFGPRLEGSRVLFGVELNTKTGGPGLTNLGWVLLVTMPPLAYALARVLLAFVASKNDDHEP